MKRAGATPIFVFSGIGGGNFDVMDFQKALNIGASKSLKIYLLYFQSDESSENKLVFSSLYVFWHLLA